MEFIYLIVIITIMWTMFKFVVAFIRPGLYIFLILIFLDLVTGGNILGEIITNIFFYIPNKPL